MPFAVKPRHKDSPPSTATKVFMVLYWLYQQPLTMAELNDRFQTELGLEETLSEDTLWYYFNTLKALGCRISRAKKANSFKYKLLSHSFGLAMTQYEFETLIHAKKNIQQTLRYQDVLALDRLIKKLFENTPFPISNPQAEDFFLQSRSIDYDRQSAEIHRLYHAIENHQVVKLSYESPMKGSEIFYFLPNTFSYQQGALHLKGLQLYRDDLVTLRMDRIREIQEVSDPVIQDQLFQKKKEVTEEIVIHFQGLTLANWKPWNLGEVIRALPNVRTPSLEVTVHTIDRFLLKQALLMQGHPFQIIETTGFHQEMLHTLATMRQQYQS